MGFVKTPEEIRKKFTVETFDFYDTGILSVYWEAKQEIVE